MLSICIPIYAYDVRPLVQQLHAQAQSLQLPWEIRLLDDASPAQWQEINAELDKLPGVHFDQLPQNIGRAAIRNELARRARYDYLLFLDGDGMPEDQDFLARYVSCLHPQHLLCGGRTYAPQAPADPQLFLHWYYGQQQEVRSAAQRQQQPYLGFMTNNFVVARSVLAQIPFDERITTYGHEDTLFGQAVATAGLQIMHLDNPVRHLGLEPATEWLHKQEEAVVNLCKISRRFPQLDTRLLRWGRQLQRWPVVARACLKIIPPLLPLMQRHLLHRRPPRLWVLALLKLYWLTDYCEKNRAFPSAAS